MYIFLNPNSNPQTNSNNCYDGFMDVINIVSFLIGLQNLDLNVTANDINTQTDTILKDLHTYLEKQEKHLSEQDKHLMEQDQRLFNLEKYLYDGDYMARKESSR